MLRQDKIAKAGVILCMLTCLFLTVEVAASDIEKSRARIEELFLWKVSDALGLDSKQEVEFSRIMKKIREDKLLVDTQMEVILQKLEKTKPEKSQLDLLNVYKTHLKEYAAIQIREIEQLETLLGAQKVAKYLALKEKLVTRLKGALAESSKVSGSKVKGKEPKIVHEE